MKILSLAHPDINFAASFAEDLRKIATEAGLNADILAYTSVEQDSIPHHTDKVLVAAAALHRLPTHHDVEFSSKVQLLIITGDLPQTLLSLPRESESADQNSVGDLLKFAWELEYNECGGFMADLSWFIFPPEPDSGRGAWSKKLAEVWPKSQSYTMLGQSDDARQKCLGQVWQITRRLLFPSLIL